MGPHQAAPQPHQVPDRYLRNPHFPLSLLMLAQTPRTRKTCSHSQSIHRPRKRVAYKRSGSQKQDISGIDFSMMPKTPARKKQKTAASSKRPTTTRPPTSPTPDPPRHRSRMGLGRFGFTTTSSSGSSYQAHQHTKD